MIVIAVSMVPLFFLVGTFKSSAKTFTESAKELFKPSPLWGPQDSKLKADYDDFVNGIQPPKQGVDNPIGVTD